jgi:hypothetical protein
VTVATIRWKLSNRGYPSFAAIVKPISGTRILRVIHGRDARATFELRPYRSEARALSPPFAGI